MVGKKLSHYRIEEKIGAGGMGVVYRAHDEQLDRDVAIKVLPSRSLADETTQKRFRREALSLARLNHPNVATVHEFGTQDGIDFLVTEYVSGISMDARLAAGPLPAAEVFRLGLQLAQGLAAPPPRGNRPRGSATGRNGAARCEAGKPPPHSRRSAEDS